MSGIEVSRSKMKIALVGPVTPNLINFVRLSGIDPPRAHDFGLNADLVNGLIGRGHSVDVFTTAPKAEGVFHHAAYPNTISIVPSKGRISALNFFWTEISSLRKALCERGPYDIIHAHWLYEYAYAALQTSYPVVVTIHDWPQAILKYNPSVLRLSKFLLSRRVLSKVRFATAPSPYMRDIATRKLGLIDVELIPNAISVEGSVAPRSGTQDTLLAINVGFSDLKNVKTLLRAFAILRQRRPNAELRLVGPDYGDGESAQIYAQKHRLASGVEFVGRLDRAGIKREMASASLFVHPSLEESFGLVLIEAMSQAVPVMGGANSGAVPWILGEGRDGFLTDVRDATVFARDMELALTEDVRIERALRGRQRVEAEFTCETMVDRYIGYYQAVRKQW